MHYSGMKVVWRLLLIETVLLIATGIGSALLIDTIGEYPAIAVGQLHMIIPILIGILYIKRTHVYASIPVNLGIRGFEPGLVFIIILLPAAATGYITLLLSPILYGLTNVFGEASAVTAPETVNELMWMFLSLCIIAPVFEELLFRGVFMKILDPYGSGIAIFISALAFAIAHFSPVSFLVVLIMGILMALLKIYSDSILPCIIFHSLYNFQSVITLVIEKDLEQHAFPILLINIGLAVLFPILLIILFKVFGKGKWYRGTAKNFKGGRISLVITLIIFALFSAEALLRTHPQIVDSLQTLFGQYETEEYEYIIPYEDDYGEDFFGDGYYYYPEEDEQYEYIPDEFFEYFFGS